MAALGETHERELKLAADEGFSLPELAGEPLAPRTFTSTYYDTGDLRLAAAGITLRRRDENGRSSWQLKLPSGTARLELEAPGPPGEPPDELRELLPALLHGRETVPVAALRTRREGVLVEDRGSRAEVTLDSVAVLEADGAERTFLEVEIELVAGDEALLTRIERALRKVGARPGDGRPKLFQALGLERPRPKLARNVAAAEHVRAALERHIAALLAHDPGTRLGRDPEDLHQQRVAARRLRAVLRAAGPLLDPAWSGPLREELRWLGEVLGRVRDLDVLIARLESAVEALDVEDRPAGRSLLAELRADRRRARRSLRRALASERYLDLLERLEAAARAPHLSDNGVGLGEIAAGEFRKLRKAVRALGPDPTDDELHRVRIKGKRARYAAELAERSVGKPAKQAIAAAKRFQDVLGEHQDAAVAEERLRALAADGAAATGLAAGRLIERERTRRRLAREAFPAAWKKLERVALRG